MPRITSPRITPWMRAMWVMLMLTGAGLGSSGVSWADDDGIRPVDRCQTISLASRRSLIVVKDLLTPSPDCLVIESSNVALDLNGFTIRSTSGTGFGIVANGSVSNISITNGVVEGFAVGISLAGPGNRVENVRVQDNRDTGLFLGAKYWNRDREFAWEHSERQYRA